MHTKPDFPSKSNEQNAQAHHHNSDLILVDH